MFLRRRGTTLLRVSPVIAINRVHLSEDEMRHIVIPIAENPIDEKVLFGGLNNSLINKQFFLLLLIKTENNKIIRVKTGRTKTFQIGEDPDWDDVLGHVQEEFLEQDYKCQLDFIVDAGGTKSAGSVIRKVQSAASSIGLDVSTKIIFFE